MLTAEHASAAYLIRLQLPATDAALELARELDGLGAEVERTGTVVTSVWKASAADHVHCWGEYTFPELIFYLRSWAGSRADRQLVVLEERPLVAS